MRHSHITGKRKIVRDAGIVAGLEETPYCTYFSPANRKPEIKCSMSAGFERALDEQFERIGHMMILRTRQTQADDEEEGTVEDDDC